MKKEEVESLVVGDDREDVRRNVNNKLRELKGHRPSSQQSAPIGSNRRPTAQQEYARICSMSVPQRQKLKEILEEDTALWGKVAY